MEIITLRLGAEAPAQVSWVGVGDGPPIRTGSLAEAGAACRSARLVVLVPATDVLLTQVIVPGRNRKRAMQAAPFALEEQLAEPIERLHFAFGPTNADGSLDVAVVAKRRLEQWLSMLKEAGLKADYLVPETLALPLSNGGWTLLLEGDLALCRFGLRAGLAVDRSNLPLTLLAQQQTSGLHEIPLRNLYVTDPAQSVPDLGLTAPPTLLREKALIAMTQGLDTASAINLLQGEYGQNTDWAKHLGRWKLPALLTLILLALHSALVGMELRQGRQELLALNRRIEAVYRDAFPEAKQVVNPRAQMEQQLTALMANEQRDAGFLGLLSRIGPELAKSDGCAIQRLRYREHTLGLELTLNNLAALDALKGRLQSVGGVQVEILTASAANDKVQARLEIKETTP